MGEEKAVEETTSGVASSERPVSEVVGTTRLYENGRLRLIPMPTPDPKDPLNLPSWRKRTAIAVICFFGALALSAEIVMGGLIPIFLLEYAGVNPRTIRGVDFTRNWSGPAVNPMAVLPPGVEPPDLGRISLLAPIPLLSNGVASYFLVPLSIAIGRRPVILLAATCAWSGGIWAAASTGLSSHLAARAVQGLGAGAVEALIPLVVQDMFFIHQRNEWMSIVIASQGLIIIALGIATPYIAAYYSWRWIYWITSGFGILAWLLLIFFLPETRWTRSKEELSGKNEWPLEPGEDRPWIDHLHYSPRTWGTDIGMFNCGFEWSEAGVSMLNTLRTTFYPAVVWATLANSVMIIANQGAQQIQPFALLAQGWEFQHTGLAVIPVFVASLVVYLVAGPLADRISLYVTRQQGQRNEKNNKTHNRSQAGPAEDLNAAREAEHHLPNFILPFLCGIAGAFLFGEAAQKGLHWAVLLTGSFLVILAFLTVMTLINVFSVETYPMRAGPFLVNVSSMRILIAFFFASETTTWVATKGPITTFAIYAESIVVISLGIPLLFFFGKRLRAWTAGSVRVADQEETKSGAESVRR